MAEKRYYATFRDIRDHIIMGPIEIAKFEWFGYGKTIKIETVNGKEYFIPSDKIIITNFKEKENG